MGWFGKPDLDELFARADIQGLFRVLTDGSDADQITASGMLIRLGVQRGFEHLIEMLGTGREPVRAAAAEMFGELREARAVDALAVTMDDPSETVKEAARQALVDIDTVEAQRALAEWEADRTELNADVEVQTFAYDPIMGSNRLPGERRALNPQNARRLPGKNSCSPILTRKKEGLRKPCPPVIMCWRWIRPGRMRSICGGSSTRN